MDKIEITVVFALADEQQKMSQAIDQGSCLRDLLRLSEIKEAQEDFLRKFNEKSGMCLMLTDLKYGIYGLLIDDAYLLQDKDRIEVYRPLLITPREARVQRAKVKERLLRSKHR